MNLNVWNIKDMFSVPPGTGTNKSSSWNPGYTDHPSLTDSQFLFSSQGCSDSPQSGLMDYNIQAKCQQKLNQSSQDSNPSVYQKYQAKPPLYSCDYKDRGACQSLGLSKTKGIMEQFEESKKKAKQKHDSEQVNQLICNIQVTLQDLKMTFCHIEESTDVRCKSILDFIDGVSKALQEKVFTYHESVVKAVSAKSDLEQALLDLEKKILLKDAEMTDLKSSVQSLLSGIDVMKLQHSEKHLELSEKIACLSDSMKSSEDRILSEIQKIHLVPELPLNLKDKSTQTSPTTVRDLSDKRHNTSQFTTRTYPDGSPLSQTNLENTREGISNIVSLQHKENLCTTKLKAGETCNVLSRCVAPSDVLPPSNKASDASDHTKLLRNGVENSLQHQYHGDCSITDKKENTPEYTDAHYKKGNKVIGSKYKNTKKCLKREQANKSKQNVKKKMSIRNPTHAATRAVSQKAQYKCGNKPVTHPLTHPDKETQDGFTLYSESCKSSPPVIPALVRKAQQHKALRFPHLTSSLEKSTKLATCAGDRDSITEAQPALGHSDLPSVWDTHDPYYNNMLWFPSSSPALSSSRINPVHQAVGQKKVHSWFFDSSDDSG